MKPENPLPLALLLLRLGVFLVMFVWIVDKFVEPQHASRIMAEFYSIGAVSIAAVYLLATIELVIVLGRIRKKMELRSCALATRCFNPVVLKKYLSPFEPPNLLFFAAIPMLATCFVLYYLRDVDVLWTIRKAQ